MNIKNTSALLLVLVTSTTRIHACEKPINLCAVIKDRENKAKAFAQTTECTQWKQATILHQTNNSPETSLLVEKAYNDVTKTKEFQAWMQAAIVADNFKKSAGLLCTQ